MDERGLIGSRARQRIRAIRALLFFVAVVQAFVGSLASAQPVAVGPEFQVNTYTTFDQYGYGAGRAVAQLDDGSFMVVWNGFNGATSIDVLARVYDSNGDATGSEFRVNTYTTQAQTDAAVASAGDDGFVVVWTSAQDGSYRGILGQRFDALGSKVGSEFFVNTYTTGSQSRPVVAGDANGGFVVSWQGGSVGGDGFDTLARVFGADAQGIGSEFRVNTHTTSDQRYATLAFADDGKFAVVWNSRFQDGSGSGVFAGIFDSSGVQIGSEFQVNTFTTSGQYYPVVSAGVDGEFVVAWTSPHAGEPYYGIIARRIGDNAMPVGSEFIVGPGTVPTQYHAAIAAGDDGGFVVVWEGYAGPALGYEVFGRQFDATATAVGGQFTVNTYTSGGQGYSYGPAIATDGSGGFVVAWLSEDQDGDGLGMFGQRFETNPVGCGNGVVELGEGCDDGNIVDGDCCSATCAFELSLECIPSCETAPVIPVAFEQRRIKVSTTEGSQRSLVNGSLLIGYCTPTEHSVVEETILEVLGGRFYLDSVDTAQGPSGEIILTVDPGSTEATVRANGTVKASLELPGTMMYELLDDTVGVTEFGDYSESPTEPITAAVELSLRYRPDDFAYKTTATIDFGLGSLPRAAQVRAPPGGVEPEKVKERSEYFAEKFRRTDEDIADHCIEFVFDPEGEDPMDPQTLWQPHFDTMLAEARAIWLQACRVRIRGRVDPKEKCGKITLKTDGAKGGGGHCKGIGAGYGAKIEMDLEVLDKCAANDGVTTSYSKVLAHELGHAFGLRQQEGSGGLMDNCAPSATLPEKWNNKNNCKKVRQGRTKLTRIEFVQECSPPGTEIIESECTIENDTGETVNDLHVEFKSGGTWVKDPPAGQPESMGPFPNFNGEQTKFLNAAGADVSEGGEITFTVQGIGQAPELKRCYWTKDGKKTPKRGSKKKCKASCVPVE